MCKRPIDSASLRYCVKMEVAAAFDPEPDDDAQDDRDHLLEVQEMLARLDAEDGPSEDDVYQELRYDLCPECCRKFLKKPLSREPAKQLNFSQN